MNILESRNKKGFTLIELLVVIAIIGILAAIVFVNVNDIRRKARNVQRLSDTKNYATVFDLVLDKYGEYPDPGDTGAYCLGDYAASNCFWAPRSPAAFDAILAEFTALNGNSNIITTSCTYTASF